MNLHDQTACVKTKRRTEVKIITQRLYFPSMWVQAKCVRTTAALPMLFLVLGDKQEGGLGGQKVTLFV